MKFGYKVIILVAVFIGALFVFSGGINRAFFATSAQTVEMSERTLPVITMEVDGNQLNTLYGYLTAIDAMTMRETITPLKSDRVLTVQIDEPQDTVRKLRYEILNDDGLEIESGDYTVVDSESGYKRVRIALKETMKSGKEYVARITLITKESKRIYYYTRLKMYKDGHLEEKLDFINYFHKTLLSGDEEERLTLKKYLESSKSADITTYAYLNIKSSYDMLNWGELNPKVVWEAVPQITEFYENMASVRLTTKLSVGTEYGTEHYIVHEDFRVSYTALRMYLYNYERSMEALFDGSHVSLTKDEFKLGITSNSDVRTMCSDSHKYIAFVYGRELYEYAVDTNKIIEVFAFRRDDQESCNEEHDLKLLRMHGNGDLDFVVYGYMNRGEYEGRVGIVLYTYIAEDHRIEEKLYVPVGASFELMRANMADFWYLSEKDIFYFELNGTIYAYDIVTKSLNVLAKDIPENRIIFCEEDKYVCWQETVGDTDTGRVHVMTLEDGAIRDIVPTGDSALRLYGRIDNNMIYGEVSPADAYTHADGSVMRPAYRLFIEAADGHLLKEYNEDGYLIDSVEVGDSLIVINRLVKNEQGKYETADSDSIVNRRDAVTAPAGTNKRVTDRTLTEYYIYMPQGVDIKTKPETLSAENTVINFDTTMRLGETESPSDAFYTYSFGEIVYRTDNAADAIAHANAAVGSVINADGRLIWERGVKSAKSTVTGVTEIPVDENMNALQAALRTMLLYRYVDADTTEYTLELCGVCDYLRLHSNDTIVDLSGTTLDDALYYVYKGRPVLNMDHDGHVRILIAYDSDTVTYYDPAEQQELQVPKTEAEEIFTAGGSIYISYVE